MSYQPSAPFVEVMPLQPPFPPKIYVCHFEGYDKQLAVSPTDYERLKGLLGDNMSGRHLILSACPDNVLLRIEVSPS
jgi:hypothetical protein